MPTAQPAPDRMTVLARIDILVSTLHDLGALARDVYGVGRIASNIVELAFPNCPDELVRLAMRYADSVRIATEFAAAFGHMQGRGGTRMTLAADASACCASEAIAAGKEFESAMQAHYAPKS